VNLPPRVAIVAALEWEVRPLIENWQVAERKHEGRRFKFFESDGAVLVCGGIGAEAARRACEAVIALYQPAEVVSAGFAGALDSLLKVGGVFTPRRVIDAADGSSVESGEGSGVLVSVASVANVEQKTKLKVSYGAQAVDMEAAAVARGAQARGVRFTAVKAISDENEFAMLPMERFADREGRFGTARFVIFALVRPWLWLGVLRLNRNSARASRTLCEWLAQYNHPHRGAGASELQAAASRERQ
jgi:nucleoside phosphorylase